MKTMRKLALLLIIIMIVPLCLVACVPAGDSDFSLLKLATSTFPKKLNPYIGNDQSETFVTSLIYEPVCGWDIDAQWYNDSNLANASSIKSNGKTLTKTSTADDFEAVTVNGQTAYKVSVQVKSNAKWSNGEPVTAADIVYTYTYLTFIARNNGTSSPFVQADFINTSVIPDGSLSFNVYTPYGYEVDKDDDRTVNLFLRNPSVDGLRTLFTSIMIINAKDWDAKVSGGGVIHSSFPNLKPVGSGPYMLKSFDTDQKILVVRNGKYVNGALTEDYYHSPENYGPDQVFLKYIGEPSAAIAAVTSADVDGYIDAVSATDAKNFQTNPEKYSKNMKLYESSSFGIRTLLINTRSHKNKNGDTVTYDPRFRMALSLVIDQQLLINEQIQGFGTEAGAGLAMDPAIVGRTKEEIRDNPFATKADGTAYKVNEQVANNETDAMKLMTAFMTENGYTMQTTADGQYFVKGGTPYSFVVSSKSSDGATKNLIAKLAGMLKKVGIKTVENYVEATASDSVFKPDGSQKDFDGYLSSVPIDAGNYSQTYGFHFQMNYSATDVPSLPGSTFNYGSLNAKEYTQENINKWFPDASDAVKAEYAKIAKLNEEILSINKLTGKAKEDKAKDIQQLLCGTYYKLALYSSNYLYFYNETRFSGFTEVPYESLFNTQTFKNLKLKG